MTDTLAIFLDAAGSCFDPIYQLVAEQGNDGDPTYTPTWGALFDVTQCPTQDLPYLGQYVGVSIPLTASDPVARQLIQAEAGLSRGTPGSLVSAVLRSISIAWEPGTTFVSGGPLVYYAATPGIVVYYTVTTTFTSGSTFDATDLTIVDPTSQYQIYERATNTLAEDAYQLTVVVNPAQLTPASDTTALIAAISSVKPAGILLNVLTGAASAPLVSQYTRNFSAITAQLSIAALADVT